VCRLRQVHVAARRRQRRRPERLDRELPQLRHLAPTLAGIRPGAVAIFRRRHDPTSTYHLGVVAEVSAAGVQIISGNVNHRITKHDINQDNFNGDFIGYVSPIAA
jgi:hypothetical protein